MPSPDHLGEPDADTYASYTLDHHGLVAGMVDELGLAEKIAAGPRPAPSLRGAAAGAGHHGGDVERRRAGARLGRHNAFGVEAFYFLLASGVVKQLGLSGTGGHLDSTSFHVDGEYNSGDGSAAEGVAHIRQGYSRDHRPDPNQVVLQLAVEN